MPGACRGQNKALDLLEMELQMAESPCGRWESEHLEEQPVLLTAEPSLQPW